MTFAQQADAFRRFLRTAPRVASPDGRAVAVLVLPWMSTAVPWSAITLALLEQARGRRPTVIFDDLPPPNPSEPPEQIAQIAAVLAEFGETLEIRRLSEFPPSGESKTDSGMLDRLAVLNAAYLHRTHAFGEAAAEHFRAAIGERIGRLRAALAGKTWDHVLLPGGIYSTSGVFRHVAAEAGLRTACYDSGPRVATLGTDAIAGHCRDLAKIFDPLHGPYLAEHRERALELARREFDLRRRGKDRRGFQTTASGGAGADRFDVLIPMNVFDDAAALGRNRFFADPSEWIGETVAAILKVPGATVVVREHPGMRWLGRVDTVGAALCRRVGPEPRFRFVSCRESVSTYDLLENCRVVLPYASTVGVEAAVLGKRVIVESDVYYAGLGFVEQATSREDYLARVCAALAQVAPLPPAQRELATLCYFFGQVANFVHTRFTSQPADFGEWVRRDFADLAADPKVETIVTVLAEGVPSWRLQSERIFAEGPAPESAPRFSWRRLLGRSGLAGPAAKP